MRVYPRSKWDTGTIPSPTYCSWKGRPGRIHHTVTTFKYTTRSRKGRIKQECSHMRYLKGIALSRGFSDISYNYVAFPSGRIYVGRGIKVVGAHTLGHNEDPGLAAVGNYAIKKPTRRMVASIAYHFGSRLPNKHGTMRKMYSHDATYATSCCGYYLKKALKL